MTFTIPLPALELMSPLAIHERPHRIIADIVKAILDSQGRDWEDFGSTTSNPTPASTAKMPAAFEAAWN